MQIPHNLTNTLFGVFLKLGDDMYDNPAIAQYFNPMAIEFIKGFTFVLLTHISTYDFNYIFVLFFSHIIFFTFFDKECLNNGYLKAGMAILAILCISSFPANFNLGIIVLAFSGLVVGWYIENKYFKEEFSDKKILFRTAGILAILGFLFVRNKYSHSKLFELEILYPKYTDTGFYSLAGYCVVSVVNMMISQIQAEKKLPTLVSDPPNLDLQADRAD